MSELRTGFLTMATIVLICLGLTMTGTGLYHKKIVSKCIGESDGSFVFIGLLLLVFPQFGLYAICLRSKRIFTFYIYAMMFVFIVLSGYSLKCFIYNTTFGIAKNPSQETRTVKQLVGRLVPAEKLARATDCIIHNHDCNFNASLNSNVWKFCCAQPPGCGEMTMFGAPGEWSWKRQHVENKVPEECAYDYCLSCRGCQLSILKAIVHQWKYLSIFAYPSLFLVCLSLVIAKFILDTFDEPDDYRGSYS
ncbi:hypothetical protein Bca4012_070932 [Brassica carinata]|uniref:Uncharacterized protein n=3 Tax=Brassica TaxID=3705 RepID=A0A8X7QG10_BRACI|nr:tetraspanin-16 [Brassica napus]KAG2268662.1 hypothetical protein Bca52824_063217 [Brassica carinata]CAF1926615.1 unnamed protein product [Brassica napus]CDY19218.1 BnaC05g14190D [Brassica napus]VDD42832.1 unnamed protein product [Brassica oleracea]